MAREKRFSVDTLNCVDLSKVPERVQTELCVRAFDLVREARQQPGYQERFEKWLAEQSRVS